MIAAIMDNPFAIGDLVHIPQGTTLYKLLNTQTKFLFDRPMPIKTADKPLAGYIINKSIYDFYIVGVGDREYMIKSDEIKILNGVKNVY
jgi:hypothetical protein